MATITETAPVARKQSDHKLPELENGDQLTRAEFERRYEAMPHLKKVELIEGVVHMPSPVRHKRHSRPHNHLSTWLGYFRGKHSRHRGR